MKSYSKLLWLEWSSIKFKWFNLKHKNRKIYAKLFKALVFLNQRVDFIVNKTALKSLTRPKLEIVKLIYK